jgi:L-lactate dehydrogenase complex protein LldG
MTSRDAILQRVRGEVSKYAPPSAPPVAEVWAPMKPAPAAMAEQFIRELTAISGEVIRCADLREAKRRLAELVAQSQWTTIGAMDRPMVREATADLPAGVAQWAATGWQPRQIAEFSASLIEPEALLADTGSCLVACGTAEDRLLCYLPPACVVIARIGQLVEHLPAAWPPIAKRAADPALRGEFVILTGPSRTADIEKILILGVHGPKRLVVLLVEG